MNPKSALLRGTRWLYKHYKPTVFAAGFYLLVIILKSAVIPTIDPAIWYKQPLLEFTKLTALVAITLFLLTLVTRIPYIRYPFLWLGIIFLLLLGVEMSCLCIYEWQHRPGIAETKMENGAQSNQPWGRVFLQNLFTSADEKPEDDQAITPFVEAIPASALDVDVLPDNYDQLKIPGEPNMRKQEPAWSDWQTEEKVWDILSNPTCMFRSKHGLMEFPILLQIIPSIRWEGE